MPQDNRTAVEKLIAAHESLMKVHICGEESLAFAQALLDLTSAVNELKMKEENGDEVSCD